MFETLPEEAQKKKADLIESTISYFIDNFYDEISLEDVERELEISKYTLCRKFQKEHGISPIKWLWCFRTILASEFIRIAPSWSLTDIAFSCGFTSLAHFSRSFTKFYEVSPSEVRKAAMLARIDAKVDSDEYSSLFLDNHEAIQVALSKTLEAN